MSHLHQQEQNRNSSISLFDLPPELFSNVLASFCDGKTISTFLMASQPSREFDAFDTVQFALVQRYEELTAAVSSDPNIGDTLSVLMEQIRSCERTNPQCMKLFSERCAILDYFESQLLLLPSDDDDGTVAAQHWLIWCGEFESFYGPIQAGITSPYWSISALASWYRDLELSQFSLVQPRVPIDRPTSYPFGSIIGIGRNDCLRMDRIRIKLEDNYADEEGYWKGMLTALHFAYDDTPPLVITTHRYPILEGQEEAHRPIWLPATRSMCCYWDGDHDGYDDEALQNLGEHIIRLMERFSAASREHDDDAKPMSFRESWGKAVLASQQHIVEFSYYDDDDDDDDDDELEDVNEADDDDDDGAS